MTHLLRTTAIAAFAVAAFMSTAATTPATASEQANATQEFSARTCRTVVTHRWQNGHRVAVKRTSCTPSYSYGAHRYGYASVSPGCRYVTKTNWHDGRRVTVRTRVCG